MVCGVFIVAEYSHEPEFWIRRMLCSLHPPPLPSHFWAKIWNKVEKSIICLWLHFQYNEVSFWTNLFYFLNSDNNQKKLKISCDISFVSFGFGMFSISPNSITNFIFRCDLFFTTISSSLVGGGSKLKKNCKMKWYYLHIFSETKFDYEVLSWGTVTFTNPSKTLNSFNQTFLISFTYTNVIAINNV